jgi:hypothetical protein
MKRALGRILPRLRDFWRLRRSYRAKFGYFPRVAFAKTFNEKLWRRKFLDRDPRMPLRADKLLVKTFVAEKLGPGWVTPTLWHGAALPPLHERKWPRPFVLKANHGSGWNIFVRSANDLDWPRIEALCATWLSSIYGESTGEWFYNKIERQLLIEPFIGNAASLPIDYKLWAFGGRVELIQVDTDREHQHKRAMFDREWKQLPFTILYPIEERHIDPPHSLERMIAAAQTLSEGMSFVRVDLYEIDGAPRFGEMTFYPGAGLVPFDPPEYDAIIGALWR